MSDDDRMALAVNTVHAWAEKSNHTSARMQRLASDLIPQVGAMDKVLMTAGFAYGVGLTTLILKGGPIVESVPGNIRAWALLLAWLGVLLMFLQTVVATYSLGIDLKNIYDIIHHCEAQRNKASDIALRLQAGENIRDDLKLLVDLAPVKRTIWRSPMILRVLLFGSYGLLAAASVCLGWQLFWIMCGT